MNKVIFVLIATILLSNFSFGQNNNLLNYTDAFLKNDVEIINLLLKNKDLKFDDVYISNLQNCKTENELISLLSKNNVQNSSELIAQIYKGIELTNNFKKDNQDFYKNDEVTRKKLLDEALEVSFANTNYNNVMNTTESRRSCYEQWQVAAGRCNRNFAIAGTGAVIAAGLTGGFGGLIAGGIAMANFWNCRQDALDDYNDCIN